MAISSHCFWPCASWPACLAASAVRSTRVEQPVDLARSSGPANRSAARCRGSGATGSSGKTPGTCILTLMPAPDARGGVQRGDVLAAEAHRAAGRRVAAEMSLKKRALAGAVRADQAVHLALLHRERQVVDGLEAAEVLAQVRSSRAGPSFCRPVVARPRRSCAARRRRRQSRTASRFSTSQTISRPARTGR